PFFVPHLHARHIFHLLHALHALHIPHRHAFHSFHPLHALHAAFSHVHPFHAFHLAFVGTAHLPIAHADPSHHGLHARRRGQLTLRIQQEIGRGHNLIPFLNSFQHFNRILVPAAKLHRVRRIRAFAMIQEYEVAKS